MVNLRNKRVASSFQFCLNTFDDLICFKIAVEEEVHDVDEASLWRRRIGSKMGFEKRTALSHVNVNKACGLNGP